MSLTTDDLTAIRDIVEDVVEAAQRQTAAGFEKVHGKLDNLQVTVDRIERVQQAEIDRVDRQDSAIQKIRKHLRTV